MHRILLLSLSIALGLPAAAGAGAAEEIDLLADGLSGWTCYLPKPGVELEDVWSIRDGVLRCEGRPAGYLRTKETYTNYILKLQWRWPKDSKPGNNGVLLRGVEGKHYFGVWPKSIEAQLAHRSAGDIWNIGHFPMKTDPARTSGRRTAKRKPSNERPQGQWNDYEIILDGARLTLKVNGEVQNRATEVAEIEGFIALQSEGAPCEFRNIILIPLGD